MRTPLLSPRAPAAPQADSWEAPGDERHEAPEAFPSQPPPGYPSVNVPPGSAALVVPAPVSVDSADVPAEGSRGFGHLVGNPLEDVSGWVDERTERLQVWGTNLVRRGERTCFKLGTSALGAAAPTVVALWWGSALTMGYPSPVNPDGERARAAGFALLMGCVLPPVIPVLGAAAGWWVGHWSGDWLISDRVYARHHDVEAPPAR